MWHNTIDCDCLQGPAAPQARPGPLGRRVSQVESSSGFPSRCMQAWQGLSAFHRHEKEYDTIRAIVTACRVQRLHRGDRGFWADGSHRWGQTLAFY